LVVIGITGGWWVWQQHNANQQSPTGGRSQLLPSVEYKSASKQATIKEISTDV
jgi:hypothetical protein